MTAKNSPKIQKLHKKPTIISQTGVISGLFPVGTEIWVALYGIAGGGIKNSITGGGIIGFDCNFFVS